MHKIILFAGVILLALSVGFFIMPSINNFLSGAFNVGDYLWLILGGLTIGFAIHVKREKDKQLEVLR